MRRIEELRIVDHAADTAVFHLRDAVGETEDAVVVRHDDDATFGRTGQVADHLHDLGAGVLIEGRGRFVADQERRLVHEGAGDGDALLLAAGERVGAAFLAALEADLVEDRQGARVGFVMMATILGMALGGWMSGWIYDQTGSYLWAFLNGIGWNVLNIGIVVLLIYRARTARRPAMA